MRKNPVGLPMMNSEMAKTFIIEHASATMPKYHIGSLVNNPDMIRAVVDLFMSEHPRGRNTSTGARLREFYTACLTLKQAQSSSGQRYRYQDRVADQRLLGLSAGARRWLATCPVVAQDVPADLTAKVMTELCDAGLVAGYFREHDTGFRPLTWWATDLGLKALKTIRHQEKLARRRKEAARYVSGYTDADDCSDYWCAGINIDSHVNAIEVRLPTEEEATALRDKILKFLKETADATS